MNNIHSEMLFRLMTKWPDRHLISNVMLFDNGVVVVDWDGIELYLSWDFQGEKIIARENRVDGPEETGLSRVLAKLLNSSR